MRLCTPHIAVTLTLAPRRHGKQPALLACRSLHAQQLTPCWHHAGRAAPVAALGEAAGERRGLGTKSHTAIQEGDDEFDQYRKRMMVGYKHRSNPLGNPRKPYY